MRNARFLTAAAALCLFSTFATPARAADVFEGAYATKFTPDEDATDNGVFVFKDSVLFHDGLLSADAISMYGFAPVAYTITNNDFTATLTSDAQGNMKWTGHRDADGLTGTLVWTKTDGRVVRYTFVGSPAAEKEKSGEE